jgi:hypothetical protein
MGVPRIGVHSMGVLLVDVPHGCASHGRASHCVFLISVYYMGVPLISVHLMACIS